MERKTGGTVRIKDIDTYIKWYRALPVNEAEEICKELSAVIRDMTGNKFRENAALTAVRNIFTVRSYASYPPEKTKEYQWPAQRDKTAATMARFVEMQQVYNQPIRVAEWVENMYALLYIGNPECGIIVYHPEQYLEYIPDVDYSDFSPAEVRAKLNTPRSDNGVMSLVSADSEASLSPAKLRTLASEKQEQLKSLEQEMEQVKKAQSGELAELKKKMDEMMAELKAKQAAMMAKLEEKKAEMERTKQQMELQIYLLDAQIYAIRCYSGEVVRFAKIRSGKNAPDTEPVVIHQKLRFLDEDLGRLTAIYTLDWDDVGMFEEFLKYSPVALDTFAPNERCVTLVRLSRTGTRTDVNDTLPFSNLLEEYKYFHGRTVGIIVRNGENLYLGWTDEQRVNISDDLIVSTTIELDEKPAPEFISDYQREQWEKQQRAERMEIVDGIVSRTYVYNILQGLVDRSGILPLPDGVSLSRQSQYVVYSLADRWLTDNRFGSFDDIVKRCNAKVTQGDPLLTVQRLVAERRYGSYRGQAWCNARGRGEANRTHDAMVSDCTIYKANLVEYDEPEEYIRYQYKFGDRTKVAVIKAANEKDLTGDAVVLERFQRRDRHVFVSAKKGDNYFSWRDYTTDVRANFELEDSEYINLTYMNSVWLSWVINNKNLGGWSAGSHEANYAYAIRYLNTALDFVRKREVEEKAMIDAIDPGICQDDEWPLKLTEWKMRAGVRNMTNYQAKRFVKAMRNP